MQRDPRAFLWDVRESALAIESFTKGMDAAAYEANPMAQAAVERKFEIIGEALNQLSKLDAAMAARIPDLAHIVAFRNQPIHGYATVNVGTRVEHHPDCPARIAAGGTNSAGRAGLRPPTATPCWAAAPRRRRWRF